MHRRAGWLFGRIARSHATHVAAACLLVERNRRSALAESSTLGAERVANLAAPRLRRTSSLAPQVLIADRSIEDDYILGPPLGSGTYAVVRQGTNRRTGKLVAVKQVPKTKQHTASILHEVSVLQRVSMHTCISELEGCYESEDSFYIVMEYVGGGELFDHLCKHGAYSERDAARLLQASGVPVYTVHISHAHYMCTCVRTLYTALHACRMGYVARNAARAPPQEIGGAVALLHAQGLCHADIKPENLLLTGEPSRAGGQGVKLVDFGLSCEFVAADGGELERTVRVSVRVRLRLRLRVRVRVRVRVS